MTTSPLTLIDGTYIRKGTKLELPTCAIHTDEQYYKNADEFDGLRFYRQRGQEPHKHQYVSVSKTDLAWGFGRHTCPGRFLAEIEVMCTLTELLLNYGIPLPGGEPWHKDIEFEAWVRYRYACTPKY